MIKEKEYTILKNHEKASVAYDLICDIMVGEKYGISKEDHKIILTNLTSLKMSFSKMYKIE